MIDKEKFTQAFLKGRIEEARSLVQEALNAGENPKDLLNQGLIKVMDQIGLEFKNGEIFIPEVLAAARAMHASIEILKPILINTGSPRMVRVVLGTVKGDLHDIGKNLVGMMLEGGGFEVIDIGIDVPPEKFIKAAKDHQSKIVAVSALLTTTMPQMKATIEALKTSGLGRSIRTIVGGAPVTEEFARLIGADGYAPDAAAAVEKVRELIS